jgi:O-succinylbenzoate synthase
MRVNRIELFQICLPFRAPYETSFGVHKQRHALLAKVYADGVYGWGEWVGDGPGFTYETADAAWQICNTHLVHILLNHEITHPNQLPDLFAQVRGYAFAKAMFEASIWDIAAQRANKSLSQFIGGTRKFIVAGVSIGIQPYVDTTVTRALKLMNLPGVGRIKLKIKPNFDIEPLKAVQAALPNVPMMVDANAAYSELHMSRLCELGKMGLMMIEQPFAPDSLIASANLQNLTQTPICLDESIDSLEITKIALALGACKIINIKQGRVGGLTHAIAIHDYCFSRDIPVWCGGMFETGVGRALNLALASLPGFCLPGDFAPAQRMYGFDITPPMTVNLDGTLAVPSRVGLGVSVNVAQLKRITLRQRIWNV